ncbi:hypothetical protein RFI_18293 [Reticulomyxa filosa]|uniref:Signal recognition particle receptor subunit beta n=1 Tax=Reticulomyxa filosa TaxID=46433 RepID=X6MY57_RETFI|nr:hypothetical protein RFI_18293 [Reticulomyxa filosa]|eukprot:ETO18950.1 hypothetical protein RFI_18293 [Reticulomyxa filosa]
MQFNNLSVLGFSSAAVIVALIIVVITVVLLRNKSGTVITSVKATVLLHGPIDSGKTLLFYTLLNGKLQPTQTSMEENVEVMKIHPQILHDSDNESLSKYKFELIDFPGHSSQETKLNQFIPRVTAVILLLDPSSSDFCATGAKFGAKALNHAACIFSPLVFILFVHPISLSQIKHSLQNVVLIARTQKFCKQESPDFDFERNVFNFFFFNCYFSMKRISFIFCFLKIYIWISNKLKESQSTMTSIQNEEDETTTIGKPGEDLTWEDLPSSISFGRISVKEKNLTDVLHFFATL